MENDRGYHRTGREPIGMRREGSPSVESVKVPYG